MQSKFEYRKKMNEYAKKYRIKNVEKVRESQRKWRFENKDKVSEMGKKWRANNKERKKELDKKYYLRRISNLPDKFGRGWVISNSGSGKSPHKFIYLPKHPMCSKQGYYAEHRLVMEKHLGRYLKKEEIVHHIDEDGLNNKIENLAIMTKREHSQLHQPKRDVYSGRYIETKFA